MPITLDAMSSMLRRIIDIPTRHIEYYRITVDVTGHDMGRLPPEQIIADIKSQVDDELEKFRGFHPGAVIVDVIIGVSRPYIEKDVVRVDVALTHTQKQEA